MFAMMKKRAVQIKPNRASKLVKQTQITVLAIRKGIRRRARSVIAPNRGDAKKISAIESALIVPYRASAFSLPTASRIQSGKLSEITPIEKIVLARSYNTQLATARRVIWCGIPVAAVRKTGAPDSVI